MPSCRRRWRNGSSAKGTPPHTSLDLGLERADDRTIWDRAIEIGAVILTKDEDFAVRKVLEGKGPSIVWVRFGNTTRAGALARFEHHLRGILDALQRGEGLVEID